MAFDRVWSGDLILTEIWRFERNGEPLNSAYVHREYPALHRAAFRILGGWAAAITLAGFDYEKIRLRKAWTKRKIVAGLREAHRNGANMSWRAFSLGENRTLAAAAVKEYHFGSWPAALKAAGIRESEVRAYRRWSDDKIRVFVRRRHLRGASLSAKRVKKAHPKLYHAACRFFGSWGRTLEACGVDGDQVTLRRRWDPEKVVAAIRALKKGGVHLSDPNIRSHFPGLHAAAVRCFGTWRNARKQLGIDRDFRFKKARHRGSRAKAPADPGPFRRD